MSDKWMTARQWMQQTGEHATELHSLVGEEIFNQILADMDEFAETVREPIRCGQPERDAQIIAQAQTELLAAIEALLPYLPDRNDAKDYAATNEGRASSFQVAAIKLREVYNRTK